MRNGSAADFKFFCACVFLERESNCEGDAQLQSYLYVLILGQLLHGIGGTTLYTVGVSLIDDSVSANASPMYIGTYCKIRLLGTHMDHEHLFLITGSSL